MPLMSLLLSFACANPDPGILNRGLEPCPTSPNCVSTRADPTDAQHYIEPLQLTGDADGFWAELARVMEGLPRTELRDEAPDYRSYVCTTLVLRFHDDVQFVLDRENGVVHFRSASRVGKSDLGVNRRRMESIREALRGR